MAFYIAKNRFKQCTLITKILDQSFQYYGQIFLSICKFKNFLIKKVFLLIKGIKNTIG